MAVQSPADLAAVVAELKPLIGGRIQQVHVVAEREVVLAIRVPGRTHHLVISARRGAGRVHLVGERPTREVPGGALQSFLRQRLAGGPLLGLAAEGREVRLDTLQARLTMHIDGGRKALLVEAPVGLPLPDLSEGPAIPERFPINQAEAVKYEVLLPRLRTGSLTDRVVGALSARMKKLKRLQANVRKDRQRLEAMAEDGWRGELIKPMVRQIRRGQPSVEAIDWKTGEPVNIPLDVRLGPQQNVERLFRRAKKASRGLPVVEARLEAIERELTGLAEERDRIRSADPEALIAMAEAKGVELSGLDLPVSGKKRAASPHPLDRWSRRFEAKDGTEIRVGKGAAANDRLTLTAKGDDLWLHARGTAGAHVVVRRAKGQPVHPEALLDAAVLAAHFSSARNDHKVEVIYTEARHVKKTKGAAAGLVGISKSKTLLVQMDPARLSRLLGPSGPAVT